MSADKPYELDPAPFEGTVHEMMQGITQIAKTWDPVEKAIFRAAWTGRLSTDRSERIQ